MAPTEKYEEIKAIFPEEWRQTLRVQWSSDSTALVTISVNVEKDAGKEVQAAAKEDIDVAAVVAAVKAPEGSSMQVCSWAAWANKGAAGAEAGGEAAAAVVEGGGGVAAAPDAVSGGGGTKRKRDNNK